MELRLQLRILFFQILIGTYRHIELILQCFNLLVYVVLNDNLVIQYLSCGLKALVLDDEAAGILSPILKRKIYRGTTYSIGHCLQILHLIVYGSIPGWLVKLE